MYLKCGVANGWCSKAASHYGCLSLSPAEVGPDIIDRVLERGRTLFANGGVARSFLACSRICGYSLP